MWTLNPPLKAVYPCISFAKIKYTLPFNFEFKRMWSQNVQAIRLFLQNDMNLWEEQKTSGKVSDNIDLLVASQKYRIQVIFFEWSPNFPFNIISLLIKTYKFKPGFSLDLLKHSPIFSLKGIWYFPFARQLFTNSTQEGDRYAHYAISVHASRKLREDGQMTVRWSHFVFT